MLRPTLRPHADQTPAQAGPSAPTNPAPIAAPSLTTMPPTYPFPHLRGNGIRAECRFATVVLGRDPGGPGLTETPGKPVHRVAFFLEEVSASSAHSTARSTSTGLPTRRWRGRRSDASRPPLLPSIVAPGLFTGSACPH